MRHVRVFVGLAFATVLSATFARANVVGKHDGRQPITTAGPQLGLSATDIDRLRSSTGYMVCDGERHGNPAAISGGVIAGSAIAITNAHLFFDKAGVPREPFESCFFRNQAQVPQTVSMDIERGFFLGTSGLISADHPRDFAVVKLAKPIPNTTPFDPFAVRDPRDLLGIKILVVTSYAPSLKSNAAEPLIQECEVHDFREQAENLAVITDCDSEAVSSGSFILVRHEESLQVLGIISSSGKKELDGEAFDIAKGSYTTGVAVSGDFKSAITAMSLGDRPPADDVAPERLPTKQ